MDIKEFGKKVAKGQIRITNGIFEFAKEDDSFLNEVVHRYLKGDFGTMHKEDMKLNYSSVEKDFGRTLASYDTKFGKVWIITDDLSAKDFVTTILLPEEY